eukprot:gene45037-60130_t
MTASSIPRHPRGQGARDAAATTARIAPAIAKRRERNVIGSACGATSRAVMKPVDQSGTNRAASRKERVTVIWGDPAGGPAHQRRGGGR